MSDEMEEHTPGPWSWAGEDYRGGWGWQMLVGPEGEGLIVGAGRDGKPSELLRGHTPLDPSLCITGLRAAGKPRADSVHVFGAANARLISSAPDLYRELSHLVRLLEPLECDGSLVVPGLATLNGARRAIAKATGEDQP